jgi:hypothetical protein
MTNPMSDLQWHLTDSGAWKAGSYLCAKLSRGRGWIVYTTSGTKLGTYKKLNGLGGAKWGCQIHAHHIAEGLTHE